MWKRGKVMSHSAVWRLWWVSGCCCSLLSMMLMMSPSCSFMCSIKRSLFVDSKPQIQQQNKSTQYSMLGPGEGNWPVCSWLWDCSWEESFSWGFWVSLGHCDESVGDMGMPAMESRDKLAFVAGLDIERSSTGTFTFSFERGTNTELFATDSSTADNFWGALKEIQDRHKVNKKF